MSTYKVGYLIGSLSSASVNRLLAKVLIRLVPDALELHEIPIAQLPLYNRDLDNDYPAPATALKESISAADAILFVTPEYNRSIPGALKNAIDWASRPSGRTRSSASRSGWSARPRGRSARRSPSPISGASWPSATRR